MTTTTQPSPLNGLPDAMCTAAMWLARIDAYTGNALAGGYVHIDSIDAPHRLHVEIELSNPDQVVLCADRLMDHDIAVKHVTNRSWRWRTAVEVDLPGLLLFVGAGR